MHLHKVLKYYNPYPKENGNFILKGFPKESQPDPLVKALHAEFGRCSY